MLRAAYRSCSGHFDKALYNGEAEIEDLSRVEATSSTGTSAR